MRRLLWMLLVVLLASRVGAQTTTTTTCPPFPPPPDPPLTVNGVVIDCGHVQITWAPSDSPLVVKYCVLNSCNSARVFGCVSVPGASIVLPAPPNFHRFYGVVAVDLYGQLSECAPPRPGIGITTPACLCVASPTSSTTTTLVDGGYGVTPYGTDYGL